MPITREDIVDRLSANGRDLSGLDLSGVDLTRLDLRGVNLSRADLSTADLRWALLEGADLHSSVLRRADCRWAILRHANLRQADLGRANLGWADITGADLTGAQIEGANLENVDVGEAVMERGPWRGAVALPASPGGLALPRISPAIIAAGIGVILVLVHLWGWLWEGAYFGAFDIADAPGVTAFFDSGNLSSGLTVVVLTLKVLVASPLLLLSLAFILALLAAIPVLFVLFGDQVLSDLERPELRTPVLAGLFLLYFILFWLFWSPLTRSMAWLFDNALPGEEGLSAVLTLAAIGPLLVQLGFVALLTAVAVLLWIGWRWLSHWIATTDLRSDLRVRYPRLNGAYMTARRSALFSRDWPLTDEERRRGRWAAVVAAQQLPTLLSQAGAVYAYDDMCDGGDLPRVQLFTNRRPEPAERPPSNQICGRLLTETDDTVYVFFPSETVRYEGDDPIPPDPDADDDRELEPAADSDPSADVQEETLTDTAEDESAEDSPEEDIRLREANVYAVPEEEIVSRVLVSSPSADCPTCKAGPTGRELAVIDPDEESITGPINQISGNLVTLDVDDAPVGVFQYDDNTAFYQSGRSVEAADVLERGRVVRAVGVLSGAGDLLEARRVFVLPITEEVVGQNASLVIDLSDITAIQIQGTGWIPGNEIAIGLGRLDASGEAAPQIPLTTVTADNDGSFGAPIQFDHDLYPAGPEWLVVARDPLDEITETADWLDEAPPRPTATPTRAPPPTESIATDTPEGPPEEEATVTPFPTQDQIPPSGFPGVTGCEPDEFEPDSGRGFQKEIFVSFAEDGAVQSHNFCPAGDKDLVFFRVKAGRWYRVFTENLAPGVDTVIAVGDLSPATHCQPAGCWNDDAGALTYASEVIFQAVEDDTALVTVDNFGTRSGTDATYSLGVQEFIPQATSTPTPLASGTPTATRTPTATPTPFKDPGETTGGNESCGTAFPLGFEPLEATLYRQQDEDFYWATLSPGTYEVFLYPPEGKDYDLARHDPDDRRCSDRFVDVSVEPGDAAEYISFSVTQSSQVILSVFSTRDFDASEPYTIHLRPLTPPTVATPIPSPTPVPSPTSTSTPTVSVPLPSAPTSPP